jgi:hypothetical protein
MTREEINRLSLKAAALAAVAGLAVAGCGSSKKKTGTVSPTSYAGAVCTTIASWYADIESRSHELESSIGPKTSPSEAKRQIENYLELALANTETAASSLRAAGVPQVSNGQRIATGVVAAFERASAVLRSAQSRFAAAKPSNPTALRNEAKQLGSTIDGLPVTVSTGFAGVNSPELDKAASESSACKRVGARPAK